MLGKKLFQDERKQRGAVLRVMCAVPSHLPRESRRR
jgi:hypothetical protein